MKYGYIRVSTKKQELARQIDSLERYTENIFTDKQTGKDFQREEYLKLKTVIQSGDELYIHDLDRLGRNKQGIKDELQWFKDHGVIVRILNMPTTLIEIEGQEWILDMINNIILEVLASVAEHEREDISRRVTEGLNSARKRGKILGRPKTSSDKIAAVTALMEEGLSLNKACKQVGIGKSTYYNGLGVIKG